jgi:hypothetical protein
MAMIASFRKACNSRCAPTRMGPHQRKPSRFERSEQPSLSPKRCALWQGSAELAGPTHHEAFPRRHTSPLLPGNHFLQTHVARNLRDTRDMTTRSQIRWPVLTCSYLPVWRPDGPCVHWKPVWNLEEPWTSAPIHQRASDAPVLWMGSYWRVVTGQSCPVPRAFLPRVAQSGLLGPTRP